MLFTRCPECDTTFRVNDETLKKAGGQVRCGRCASVFNAYAELHDPTAKSFEPEPAARTEDSAPPSATPPPAAAPVAPAKPPTQAAVPQTVVTQTTAEAIGVTSASAVVARASVGADDAAAASGPVPDAHAISATEVDRVLTDDASPPVPQLVYAWLRAGERTAHGARSRWWAAGAAVALLVLGIQSVHHFRSDIAGTAAFGPLLTAIYGAAGGEITPSWDVHQYEIIDWVATAEPNSRGLGSLKITARIQNRGPLRQPYPAVQLKLKDRWEAAVGSRTFTPAEYLPHDAPRGGLMSPGETAQAEIEVVDPGPDAYGFELDVCIEVEASLVTCGSDEIFL